MDAVPLLITCLPTYYEECDCEGVERLCNNQLLAILENPRGIRGTERWDVQLQLAHRTKPTVVTAKTSQIDDLDPRDQSRISMLEICPPCSLSLLPVVEFRLRCTAQAYRMAFSLVQICEPSFSATLELTSRQVKSRQETIDRRSLFSPVVVAPWRQRRNTRGRDENEAWKTLSLPAAQPQNGR